MIVNKAMISTTGVRLPARLSRLAGAPPRKESLVTILSKNARKNTAELLARVDALYRRVEIHVDKPKPTVSEITLGRFTLDLRKRILTKNGKIVELTQVEYQIVEYFFKHPETTIGRSDILARVWGDSYIGEEKIVDVNIRRLRKKIEEDASDPKYLITVWGLGYKWTGEY